MIVLLLIVITLAPLLISVFSARASYIAGIPAFAATGLISFFALLENINRTGILSQYLAVGIDPLSSAFLLILSLVWILTSYYSVEYDRGSRSNSLSYNLAIFAMVILVLSRSFPVFISAWETMTISGFLLLGYRKGVSSIPPYVFLVYGELSTLFVIIMAAGMYFQSGSLLFNAGIYSQYMLFIGVTGFFIKMGVMPFQITEWLPIAHGNASTNGSILFSATMTTAAVYSILRFVSLAVENQTFGILIMAIGAFSLMFGAIYAASSEHVKMLPAYSTIENSGAMLILVGSFINFRVLGSAEMEAFSMAALMIFAFAHAMGKAGLFMFSGIMEQSSGSTEIKSYRGGSNSTYYGAGGFLISTSLSGMLPLGGGVGEWMLLESLFVMAATGNSTLTLVSTVVGAMAALGAGISIISMTKIFGYGSRGEHERGRKEGSMRTALLIAGGTVLLAGTLATLFISMINNAVIEVTGLNTTGMITGALIVPEGLLIQSTGSSGTFGVISPLFAVAAISAFSLSAYALAGRRKVRRVDSWNGGIKEEDTLHSFAYANSLRLTMKRLYLTREERKGTDYSERTFDAFWIFMLFAAKKFAAFSKLFGRGIMNSSLASYVFYIIIAFFAVMLYVAL